MTTRDEPNMSLADEALFSKLRAYRDAVAAGPGAKPGVVMSDRTLREIAIMRPRRIADLRCVYGPSLLAIVEDCP